MGTTSNISVALCLVVFNEINRIADTIKNASPFVDEICIVDQESNDGTWEWLNEHAHSMDLKIQQDIHWGFCEPSRIKVHNLSTADWVLVLDADERLDAEFGQHMRELEDIGFLGARLQRSLWIGKEHRFTGDYQYRYFKRDCVKYLDSLHTEPQPTISEQQIFSTKGVAIWHEKSWIEQIRDELAYESLLENKRGLEADRMRTLNVHLQLLRELGYTAEEADAMTIEERNSNGLGAS